MQKGRFLWWSWFKLRTLHILCIVHTNWVKFTKTDAKGSPAAVP